MSNRSRSRQRGGGASLFTPAQLGSLLYAWYRADAGVTLNSTTVSAWGDQSGNGRHLSQATAGVQPLFVAGTPAVLRFSNLEWIGASIGALAAPFGVYLTCKLSGTSNPGGAGDFDYLYSLGHGVAGSGGLTGLARWRPDGSGNDSKIYTAASEGSPAAYYDGSGASAAWRIYSHTHATSAPKNNLRIGGTAQTLDDYTTSLSVGGLFTVGGYNSNATPTVINLLSADVHEIVVISGTLSSYQQTALERYLARKVGATVL